MIDISPISFSNAAKVTLVTNSSITSGWFILQFLTALTSIRVQNLQKQHNITLTSEYQIKTNYYEQFLTDLQYSSISTDKTIKLYPLQKQFETANKSIKFQNKCIVKSIKNWQPNDRSIAYQKLSSDLYVVQTSCEQLISDNRIKVLHSYYPKHLLNRYSGGFLQSGSEQGTFEDGYFTSPHPLFNIGIHGENQIISVTDSGVDYNHSFFYDSSHPTISFNQTIKNHRKIQAYYAISDAVDERGGHGTHVSGTALGECYDPESGASLYNGISPKSKLFFVDIKSGTGEELDSDFDGEEMYNIMSNDGVSICSNSWGYEYISDSINHLISLEYDKFAFDHPEIAFVFAAGNEGGGYIGPKLYEFYYSINSPGDSKNCLSVGSTSNTKLSKLEQQREYILEIDGKTEIPLKYDGFNADPYKFPIESNPMKKQANLSIVYFSQDSENVKDSIVYIDTIDDTFCTNVYSLASKGATAVIHKGETTEVCNTEQKNISVFTINEDIDQNSKKASIIPISLSDQKISLSYFSSRGPSFFLINKPDVVAPGDNIISAKSGDSQSDEPQKPTLDTLFSSSGTSMSTPAVSGLLALIRQYLTDGYYPSRKATTTDKIEQITSNLLRAVLINSANPLETENLAGPNIRTGFGIPNLSNSLLAPLRLIAGEGIGPYGKHTYEIKVDKKYELDLRITMAYLDPPLSFESTLPHFADLDLLVVSPNGRLYTGNGHANNQTETSNTIERVVVPQNEIETGAYQIIILSSDFPDVDNPTIQYSLAINGPFDHFDYDSNPITLPKIANNKCSFECLNEGTCDENTGRCKCDDSHTGVNCGINIESLEILKEYRLELNSNEILYTKIYIDDINSISDPALITAVMSRNTVYQVCLSSTPFYSLSDPNVSCLLHRQGFSAIKTGLIVTEDDQEENTTVYLAFKTNDPAKQTFLFEFNASIIIPPSRGPIITVKPTDEAADHPEEKETESNLNYSSFFVIFCIIFGFLSFIFILLNIAFIVIRCMIYKKYTKKE